MNRKLIGLILAVASYSANANYQCDGGVDGVTIEPKTGVVFAQNVGGFIWPRLCSVTHEYNGIPPESCKLVYSTLLAAQTTNKEVRLWFNDEKDCSLESHPSWQQLTGWYFGPSIRN
ncbi:hypothetical protein [Alteromonas sp. ASW11-130]|uniref:hypothetical protein n=1 Tax=Alteromonas sp. ASW11-130 TaxID=3015775 RepID=UPI002242342D|nr:hypothetical protein [Alteromonas sp. ASW11-130]MCW8091647.1 hypothetical protein [Alteromonas sp. ASW11-130]